MNRTILAAVLLIVASYQTANASCSYYIDPETNTANVQGAGYIFFGCQPQDGNTKFSCDGEELDIQDSGRALFRGDECDKRNFIPNVCLFAGVC